MKHILFVCSANVNRSKAFEKTMNGLVDKDRYEIRSAGIWSGYPYQINDEILTWADDIYVMDLSHRLFIHKNYRQHLSKVKVIGISDQYDVDSDELFELIIYWYTEVFKNEEGNSEQAKTD